MQVQDARQPNQDASQPTEAAAAGLLHPRTALALTLAVAVLCIFVLPLVVPVRPTDTISTSYLAGFNNTVATLSAAGISVLTLLFTLKKRQGAARFPDDRIPHDDKLSLPFLAGVILVSAAVLALCGRFVAASHNRYLGDAGYFIEQATVRLYTGRSLYTQLEFAYGPLLLLPIVWLSRLLHLSVVAAYYLTLVLEESAGLTLLAYVLNALPIRGSLRKAALLLLAFGCITVHLGLNYTLLRFVTPYALLLLATSAESPWLCALLLSLSEVLALLISPELGLALSIGILTFGGLRAWSARATATARATAGWRQAWPWLATAAIPLAVLATLLLTLGRSYLRMAASFSRGALNLPVGPYPHLLVFLFALVWLVPLGLGRFMRLRDPASARVFAVYATGLAFLPAALGRCDPLHVMFDGIGILLLGFFAVSRSSRRVRHAWVAAVALLVVWNHFVNERLFSIRTAEVARQAVMPHLPATLRHNVIWAMAHRDPGLARMLAEPRQPDFYLDTAALDAVVGNAPIATPIEISPLVEDQLRTSGHWSPGYYAFWVDMMNTAAEGRSIAEANAHRWMLLPADWRPDSLSLHMPGMSGIFQGFNLHYHLRNPIPYQPGVAFLANLHRQWTPVKQFGPYMLYENRGATVASDLSAAQTAARP